MGNMRRLASHFAVFGATFAALCVFLALVASPGRSVELNPWPVLHVAMEKAVPRAKPDRNADPALPEGVVIERQCPASTLLSRAVDADGTRVFYARYSRTAFNEMVEQGCTRIQQGCNVCMVTYTGCTDGERAACADAACLEKVCKRRMVCTSKRCSAYSDTAPPCTARFVRQACLENAFAPLDSEAVPRE